MHATANKQLEPSTSNYKLPTSIKQPVSINKHQPTMQHQQTTSNFQQENMTTNKQKLSKQ